MGQQLSSESYCLTTIQKLACELNTTDSQVSESQVTSHTDEICTSVDRLDGGDSGDAGCYRIAFPWREWARVSKHLERVLPNSEQKRLLTHVLLNQTGLQGCTFADTDAADITSDLDFYGGSGGSGCSGPQPTPASRWSVHLNYGDDSDKNAVLYRDFVKMHFQLDNLSQPQVPAVAATVAVTVTDRGESATANGSRQGSHDSGLSSLSAASAVGSDRPLTDRLTEQLRQQCDRIGVGLVVTKAAYHARDNCVVISCTIDIRSILRNTGGLELRSRVNYDVEDTELGDQLQRSLSGLRDKISSQQQLMQQQPYFPMVLYLCSSRNRVILIYNRQQRVANQEEEGPRPEPNGQDRQLE